LHPTAWRSKPREARQEILATSQGALPGYQAQSPWLV
jgi:hypothetical protein